jgi:general secretion pathway protein C
MSRKAILVLNASLGVCACFLLANLIVTLLTRPDPVLASVAPRLPVELRQPSWDDRRVILERNLFNVSVLAPAADPSAEEELEATKLPLKLLGTVAADLPELSWAAVQDLEGGGHLVVRVDQTLLDRARVLRIERRRIVLQNGARREELALEGDEAAPVALRTPAPAPRPSRPRAQRPGLQERLQRLSENRMALDREAVAEATRNPTNIFSQARILPKYEEGAMVGVQVNAIKPGSLLEEIGLRNGDTISQVNGIAISTPEDSTEVLRELAQSTEFTVVVTGADGLQRTLTYEVQE